MTRALSIIGRLLEDEPPELNPQSPEQPEPEGGSEDIRDLFFRLNRAPDPFQATGIPAEHIFRALSERLGRRRRLKVGTATYLLRLDNQTIALRYHETDVLTFHDDGRTVATTGGWPTKTTRARLAEYLPGGWRIYSESFKKHGEEAPELYAAGGGFYGPHGGQIRGGIGKLFWYNSSTKAGTFESGWQIPFTDGDEIMPDGKLKYQTEPKPRNPRAEQGWP